MSRFCAWSSTRRMRPRRAAAPGFIPSECDEDIRPSNPTTSSMQFYAKRVAVRLIAAAAAPFFLSIRVSLDGRLPLSGVLLDQRHEAGEVDGLGGEGVANRV